MVVALVTNRHLLIFFSLSTKKKHQFSVCSPCTSRFLISSLLSSLFPSLFSSSQSPLIMAVTRNDVTCTKILLDHGALVDQVDSLSKLFSFFLLLLFCLLLLFPLLLFFVSPFFEVFDLFSLFVASYLFSCSSLFFSS